MLIKDLKYWKDTQGSNFGGKYFGMDKPKSRYHQLQAPHNWWANYPVQDFDYNFNLWGFRGPDYNEYVGQPINLCLGDSFTLNMGGPIEYSWPSKLDKLLDLPTINLGMNGAGNDAIRLVYDRACKVFDVQETFVMYSYFHRRLVDGRFTHYGPSDWLPNPPVLTTAYENQVYFTENMIVGAHEAFLPNWCWTDEEKYLIDNHPHFDYPHGGRMEWANRDFHHMNEELNGKVAEYFYDEFKEMKKWPGWAAPTVDME
jgi:hypothetical protein